MCVSSRFVASLAHHHSQLPVSAASSGMTAFGRWSLACLFSFQMDFLFKYQVSSEQRHPGTECLRVSIHRIQHSKATGGGKGFFQFIACRPLPKRSGQEPGGRGHGGVLLIVCIRIHPSTTCPWVVTPTVGWAFPRLSILI